MATGYAPIIIYYGTNYTSSKNFNDGISWRGTTAGTLDMPEQETVMADTIYSSPYFVRNKKKERLFSIVVEPIAQPYTPAWYTLVNSLYTILHRDDNDGGTSNNNSKIRVAFQRNVNVYHYLDARLNEVIQTNKTQFEIRMTADNPIYKELILGGQNLPDNTIPDMVDADINTDFTIKYDNTDSYYLAAGDGVESPGPPPISYTGSSPETPTFTFQLNVNGYLYRYHKDFTVKNNSPQPLTYYPICLNLGDLRATVTAGKMHQTGTNPDGIDTHKIKDIRIETAGGARKTIYIRDRFEYDGTGAWNQDVRVWFMLYNLASGETKSFRLLYGNANASYKEVYPEDSSAKCMFNMYLSDNTAWNYLDFMPQWNQQQTRIKQWTQYAPNKINLQPIITNHPAFSTPQANLVPCAGGQGMAYAGTSGYAGVQLSVPVGISTITGDFRVANNGKLPFVLRIQHRDGRWEDIYQYPTQSMVDAGTYSTAVRETINTSVIAGATTLKINVTTTEYSYINVNDFLVVLQDDSTYCRVQITAKSILGNVATLTISPGVTSAASAGNYVYQHRHVTGGSWSFLSGDEPQTVAFVVRGDRPDLVTGGWYFGGMEALVINFASSETPVVLLGSEVDIASSTRYQLRGKFGNSSTQEFLTINTITTNFGDKVVVDCTNRTCSYYAFTGVGSPGADAQGYQPAENRLEALSFSTIRPNWVHLIPLGNNVMVFYANSDSNFTGSDVRITYNNCHYW